MWSDFGCVDEGAVGRAWYCRWRHRRQNPGATVLRIYSGDSGSFQRILAVLCSGE